MNIDPRLQINNVITGISTKVARDRRRRGGRQMAPHFKRCCVNYTDVPGGVLEALARREGAGEISDDDYMKGVKIVFKEATDACAAFRKEVKKRLANDDWQDIADLANDQIDDLEKTLKKELRNLLR